MKLRDHYRWTASAIIVLLTALFGAILVQARPEPAQTVNSPPQSSSMIVGVQTHIGGRNGEQGFSVARTLQTIKALGFDWVRDDVGWSAFVAPNSRQTRAGNRLLIPLLGSGVRPLLVFGLGDPRFNDGTAPRGPQQLAGFGRFVAGASDILAPYKPMIEIWNEWNLGTGQAARARGSAADYVALVNSVAASMADKPDRPRLLVGSGGDDAVGWRWTMDVIARGGLTHADGLAVHVYNQCLPTRRRTAEEMVDSLVDLHRQMVAAGVSANFPVYVTEIGWPNHQGRCGLTAAQVAANMVRLLPQLRLLPWLKGVWLYDLRDDGIDPTQMEQRFGLVDHDYQPKPAGCAVARILPMIRAGRITQVVSAGQARRFDFVMPDGGRGRIAWSGPDATPSITAPAGASVPAGCGNPAS